MHNKKIFYFILLISILFFSCSKSKYENPADLSIVESIALSPQYAVITEPYTAFRMESDINSNVVGHGRRGDILVVKSTQFIKKGNSKTDWYEFDQGWLPESVLTIYNNKLQAESASKKITNSN